LWRWDIKEANGERLRVKGEWVNEMNEINETNVARGKGGGIVVWIMGGPKRATKQL